MNKKMAVIVSLLTGFHMLAGCTRTPEAPVIRLKGENAVQRYKEAENLSALGEHSQTENLELPDQGSETESTGSGITLRTRLGAPKRWQSEVSGEAGKLNVFTDADVIIPEVEKVPAIYVKRHDFDQDDIDTVTRALFGNTDVYDARSYSAETKERELPKLAVPYEFQEELIDPWMPELGSVCTLYGVVRDTDGNRYQYNLMKKNNVSLEFRAKRISSESELTEGTYYFWNEYDSMKQLYSWVPDESSIDPGITKEEAQKLADEKAAALNLKDMQTASSGLVLELRSGYTGRPQEKDMTDTGYAFHYTRKPSGIPITYTAIPGGAKDSGMDSQTVRWGYESLDIYVTRDGIDEISFTNQYDIGEKKAENLELLPFSDIMAVYEKMMLIQNADAFIDHRAEGADAGEPVQAKNFYINKITFGYTRIYDPASDSGTGLLVPVWDFFGTYELSYDGENMTAVNDADKSFITIHAADGTVVDRWLGY